MIIARALMQDPASLRSSLQGEKSTGDIHLQFTQGNQYSGGGYEVVSFQWKERWCSISIFQSGNMVPAFIWQCLHERFFLGSFQDLIFLISFPISFPSSLKLHAK